MARWRLTQSHYLEIESLDDMPVEWEYKEIDQNTGRTRAKRFNVPFFMDINDQKGCWNDQSGIVVSNGAGALPMDYIFRGDPTPEMFPLDSEAQAISKACEPNWVHPIESLPGQGYTQSLLAGLEKQLSEIAMRKPIAISENSVNKDEFDEMKKQMAMLMERNAALEGKALESEPELPLTPVPPKTSTAPARRL